MDTTQQNLHPITPFKRLISALVVSNAATFIALMPPIILLLTLKLQVIAPDNVAGALASVTSVGAFVAMLANPVAGAIGDRTRFRFGRRRTWILAGNILGGASLLGIGLSKEIWQVTLLWSCAQAFFNCTLAANNALLADQVEESRRGSISGIVGAVPAVSPLIGISLANAMSQQSDVTKWSVLALIGIVGSIIAISLIRDAGYTGSGRAKKEQVKFSLWKVIPNPRKYPTFAYAWLARFLVLFCTAAGLFNSVFLAERFHFSPEELGSKVMLTTVISTILTFLFSVVGGFISDRFKRQKPFVIGAGTLMGIALIVQGFAPNFTVVLVATVLMGIGSGVYYAVDMALLTRVLPNKDDAAKDLGILNIANALPQSIVPAITPVLLGMGGYELLFSVIGTLGILGGIAVLKVPEVSSEKNGEVPTGKSAIVQ